MLLLIFKAFIIVFSSIATFLSLVFMLSPELFSKIEEVLGMEFGGSSSFATVLEGRINFLNDWLFRNRILIGPLFALLGAMNTRNAFFF